MKVVMDGWIVPIPCEELFLASEGMSQRVRSGFMSLLLFLLPLWTYRKEFLWNSVAVKALYQEGKTHSPSSALVSRFTSASGEECVPGFCFLNDIFMRMLQWLSDFRSRILLKFRNIKFLAANWSFKLPGLVFEVLEQMMVWNLHSFLFSDVSEHSPILELILEILVV